MSLRPALTSGLRRLLRPNSISRVALFIYLFQAASVVLGLANNIILARILQPADKGVYDIFLLIMQLTIDIGMLGIGSGLLYFFTNRGQPLPNVHGTGLVFSLVMGAVVAFSGWVLLPVWKQIFVGIDDWIIVLGFIMTAVGLYQIISSYCFMGTNQSVINYQLRLLNAVMLFVPTLGALFFYHFGIREFIYLRVVANIVPIVLSFVLLFRQEPRLHPDFHLFRQSLRYGLIIYIGYIANQLHYRVDQIMLNTMMGSTAVGIYSVGVRWAEMLFMLDAAISESAFYRISSLPAHESRQLTIRLFKVQILISGGGALGLAIITYPMITILYGDAFKDAVVPLLILLPGVSFWSISKLLSTHIAYNRGMFILPMLVSGIGLALNIILNMLFIPVWGILGAAWASTISYSMNFLLIALIFRFRLLMPSEEIPQVS